MPLEHRYAPHLIVLTALLAFWPGSVLATPFVPKSDGQVLERLRTTPTDPEARELRKLHAELARSPQNLPVAVNLARRYIERGRTEADPRYNGYAQAALKPWWDQAKPPATVLVLRATLRQSSHDFKGALSDLDQAIEASPRDSQAWVTRASVRQVLGDYERAKRDCLPLLQLSTQLVGVTCLSSIASLNGQATRSYSLLERVLTGSPNATVTEKLWARTVLAEIAVRTGNAAAETHFQQAMALGPDTYLLGAYADFLLDQGRPREVVKLLQDQTRIDALLLRLALAEQALGLPALETHRTDLAARFEASRLRKDVVHRREEARFALELLKQPRVALELARANWEVQHEPADARLLLTAARAASDPKAARPVLDWLTQTRLEDVQLAKLSKPGGQV